MVFAERRREAHSPSGASLGLIAPLHSYTSTPSTADAGLGIFGRPDEAST